MRISTYSKLKRYGDLLPLTYFQTLPRINWSPKQRLKWGQKGLSGTRLLLHGGWKDCDEHFNDNKIVIPR